MKDWLGEEGLWFVSVTVDDVIVFASAVFAATIGLQIGPGFN